MPLQKYEKSLPSRLSGHIFFLFLHGKTTIGSMTTLIADSGSTKTDWVLLDGPSTTARIQTQGINPVHQSAEAIGEVLTGELLPRLGDAAPDAIHFYGSGCTPATASRLREALQRVFTEPAVMEVQGDLIGAARALLGHHAGLACILGTGANSCLYDGRRIVANTPPLGFILGDEGSGAALGKCFLNAIFKGFLPGWMRDDFLSTAGLTYPDIIEKVYRQPMANRFLASTAGYIAAHVENEALEALVVANFREFFRRNLVQYHTTERTASFVGGIAWQFARQLGKAAEAEGYAVGRIMKSPVSGLAEYHSAKGT